MLTRRVLKDSLKGESEEGVSRSERRMLPPPRGPVFSPAGGGEEVCVSRPEWECQTGVEQVVEGFAGDNKEFEVDTLGDGEPVEVRQDGGDVVTGEGVCDNMRLYSSFLSVLDGLFYSVSDFVSTKISFLPTQNLLIEFFSISWSKRFMILVKS